MEDLARPHRGEEIAGRLRPRRLRTRRESETWEDPASVAALWRQARAKDPPVSGCGLRKCHWSKISNRSGGEHDRGQIAKPASRS